MFAIFFGWIRSKSKKTKSPEDPDNIGLFDVVKALWHRDYDPFKSDNSKRAFLTRLQGGRSVGWFLFFIALAICGGIIAWLYCLGDIEFTRTAVTGNEPLAQTSVCWSSGGMTLIGILTGANMVIFSILCTARLFYAPDMEDDKRRIVAEGVAYVAIQLLLAFICYLLPLFHVPTAYLAISEIFTIIFLILIAMHILFHIFAVMIYNLHAEKQKPLYKKILEKLR